MAAPAQPRSPRPCADARVEAPPPSRPHDRAGLASYYAGAGRFTRAVLADLGKAPARPRQRSQIAGLRAGYTALLNLYREGESLAGDATALQRIDPTIEAVERRLKLQAGAAGLAACAVGS